MKKIIFAILIISAFIFQMNAQDLPAVDPAKVKGNIITAGSSTVFPLSEKIAERFKKEGYTGSITIDSIGSGAGFERFCKTGETDIANASRKIKSSEIELAGKLSPARVPVEFRIGTDALAVVVSSKNNFVKNLTKDQLVKIFSTAENWSDVDPSWPKKPIKRFIPGTDSGTFDYFVEDIFKKDKKPVLAAKNLQLSEDDNVLVQGISKDQYAIGFFGFAYYMENSKILKVCDIEGVTPNADTVNANKYPLSRPLFIYSDAGIMKSKPQVAVFINYYLTNVDKEIKKVGYFPAPADILAKSKQNWLDANK